MNPLESEVRNPLGSLNPLLIGAQCERSPDGASIQGAGLNPLLIGAQCELFTFDPSDWINLVSIPF